MTEQPPAGDQRPAPAPRAGLTTPENPWPLRLLAENLHAYIARCDPTWVEGQIIEINQRPRVTFLTLRDVDQEISVPVTLFPREMQALETPLEKGMRVVAQVRPDYWTKTGRLSMIGHGVRPVGLGDLLVRIEQLRRALAEEGLFDAERKRPIPQLPQRVGLITGRNSDAEKDVVRIVAQPPLDAAGDHRGGEVMHPPAGPKADPVGRGENRAAQRFGGEPGLWEDRDLASGLAQRVVDPRIAAGIEVPIQR